MKKTANILTSAALYLAIPVLVFVLWELGSKFGLVNASILPPPEKVWAALMNQIEKGTLWKHIGVSLLRVLKGYLIGSIAGLLLGTLAGTIPALQKSLVVVIGVLRPIPAIALIPFFILWMGIGEESKVAVIVFGTFWPVLLNTIQGITQTDRKLLELGTILEKSKWTVFSKIILPAALPSVFTGLRLGISSAWTCVVAAEMIAASKGIGFLISYSREMAQPATLLVGIAVIGIFGFIFDVVLQKLNQVLIYWK